MNGMIRSFFSNVSHEFRTPLTMISGPVAQLCGASGLSEEQRELLRIVQRSTDRMLELVNQQMDFGKLENDLLRLRVCRTDIIRVLLRRIDIFRMNAATKGIALRTYGLEGTCDLWLDEDKQDKIFSNLMSNALKFTPGGGRIEVRFNLIGLDEARRLFPDDAAVCRRRYAKVSVANTGVRIPEEQREKIFERYYRIGNGAEGSYNYGTGIGLYYTRSLVELHHGRIRVFDFEEGGGVLADALHLAQLVRGGVQHSGQGAEAFDELVGQAVHVALGQGVEQQQLQHPVTGPALNPPGQELRFHPLPVSAVVRHAVPLLFLSVRRFLNGAPARCRPAPGPKSPRSPDGGRAGGTGRP